MKIGVGVVTAYYGSEWKGDDIIMNSDNFWKFSHNSDQTTIAKDKNKLIKQLYEAGCEHIFIFEQDTIPIKKGWEQFFIDGSNRTGVKHFVLCSKAYHDYVGYMGEDISMWHTGTGCMMYMHRSVIDKVGYINPKYGKYGYEHAGYSLRICRAGFTPYWYCTLNGWEEWVHAWDLVQTDKYIKKVNVMTQEEKDASIADNWPIFVEEHDSERIYYEY